MSILRRLALPASALLLLSLAPAPPDMTLHDLWFKTIVSAQGYSIESGSLVPHKFQSKNTAYIHLAYEVATTATPADGLSLPGTAYTYEIWTDVVSGPLYLYKQTSEGAGTFEGTDGRYFFAPSMFCEFHPNLAARYTSELTLMIKVARDKSGAVTGATLRSLGGQIREGTTHIDEDTVRGGISIKGKTVKAGKLPFSP